MKPNRFVLLSMTWSTVVNKQHRCHAIPVHLMLSLRCLHTENQVHYYNKSRHCRSHTYVHQELSNTWTSVTLVGVMEGCREALTTTCWSLYSSSNNPWTENWLHGVCLVTSFLAQRHSFCLYLASASKTVCVMQQSIAAYIQV